MTSTVAIMGAGSWGTAFAKLVADAGHDAMLWARDADVVNAINATRRNPGFHPDVILPERVRATHEAPSALSVADFAVLAVPAQSLRGNLQSWAPHLTPGCVVVSLLKGVEAHSYLRMSEVIAEVTGLSAQRLAVLSGPNLAAEIAQGQPAATTIACVDESVAERVQQVCGGPRFRPYTTTDVIGTEIGGAAKNIVAVAAGIAIGLGFGENAQAALITRGLAEITRLGVQLGADARTFSGLAGMGDLVATCGSPLSRNRTFGEHIGRGLTVAQASSATRGTCEAFETSRALLALGQAHNIALPITSEVVQVLHHDASPRDLVAKLMSRDMKSELRP